MRITAPRPIDPPRPFRFPLVASLAPLAVAVILWIITTSPYSLLFALLGPVTAVASAADSRLGARRSRRREHERYGAESISAGEAIDAAHAEERAALGERSPTARDILGRTGSDPWRWLCDGTEVPVSVGTGTAVSGVVIDGADEELTRRASVLVDAPIIVDAALGIGVCGPPALAAAATRALVLQVAWALSPDSHWCASTEPWAAQLPHDGSRTVRHGTVAEFGRRGDTTPLVSVAWAATAQSLTQTCRVVIAISADGAAIVHHPDRSRRIALRPGLISESAAQAWASSLPRLASSRRELPPVTHLATLPQPESAGLSCVVGADGSGPVFIDLVAEGPHAVIGGTTGSGKSELLVSWVLAMAQVASPQRLAVLLVDFKGGSAFAALQRVPHVVGIITDLDEHRAARALASLRAELRYRERTIAEARARDIDGTPELPRLVIVVDEFAAMLADHPDLHAVFADIAARGRSLGVHLILCTQRPAGVVRDAVLANADLRISLRVNNRADSTAVVGTDAAAEIHAQSKGRGVLAPPGREPRVVQFAIADGSDVERVRRCWPDSPPPRRPWCEPLPSVVDPTEAPDGFGLVDLPHEQRRAVAVWTPASDGHVLVLGSARSGISTALAGLAPAAIRVPRDVPAAWDVVTELVTAQHTVFVIDDLDSLIARFPADYRSAIVERLSTILRDGPARGVVAAVGARRLTAELQQLASLVPNRLLLRHISRQDWALAGGEAAEFIQNLPPGGGVWRGNRVQVASVPVEEAERQPAIAARGKRPRAFVTTRSRAGATLAECDLADWSGERPVVGDPEEWQSRWGALQSVREIADVVFEGCSLADVRALTRSRELPPPLEGLVGVGWLWERSGSLIRVSL
ncbi:MAG: cell division protein [Salinibacterium sp.]|nr:cell division protein [Salinibacterium sp.]